MLKNEKNFKDKKAEIQIMNKLNHYPPNPESCCCYCSFKKDYSPRGFRSANYSESSPSEDNEDEDEYGNRTFRNDDSAFARDEMYDNFLDMIDDQMISTMSTLRKKARKFMKSEFEQSFSSDSTSHRCNHSGSNRSKGTTVVKKANEIDYQPQSTFLKKMVQQYQCRQIEPNESDFPAVVEKSTKSENKGQNVSKPKSPPVASQKGTSSGACCCKCHNSAHGKEENSQKKSGHVSRSKKKAKCRGNRKRRSDGNCESGDQFETYLKQPHENSCERCWRFASPSRSPVNKPDQRYDPNFRRGHSCTNLNTEKAADYTDEKGTCASQSKNRSNFDTSEVIKNGWQTLTSTPKSTTPKKLSQIQNAPCEDYSAQFTPFSKGTPSRSHANEQTKPCNETKPFDFEYPPMWLSETFQSQQQKCAPKPFSCDKSKERNSLEKGIIYSGKTRNLLTRPQSLIPAKCNDNKEQEEYPSSQQYKDVCGRGRLENLDPCTKRSLQAQKAEPCNTADMEMSILRGENSIENGLKNGLKNGLNMSRGSGMDTGRNEFDRSGLSDLSEIPIDSLGQVAGQSLDTSGKKSKPGTSKGVTTPKKPSSANKSPKSKSPKGSPLRGSKTKNGVRGSKDKKGDGKKETCSTNEAQAYFKIPDQSRSPEECGVSHPIRNCQCYPRVIDNSKEDDIYCCHCGWRNDVKNESRTVRSDEADSPVLNESCCSSRPAFSEPSTFQGRRPSPTRVFNQKPTLPNIDEYPEQLYDLADGTEMTVPCPYRMYMSSRPLNDSTNANEPRCQRRNSPSRNGHFSFRDGNLSCRNENANFSQMSGNENCPRYGNGNASFGNFTMSSQVNAGSGMEYPRKYCVMYMTKGKDTTGDDVEVLVEELSQPCPYGTDDRMTNVKEKMTRMYKCPTESMALRFQKGVPPRTTVPQKSRVLYF